MEPYPTEYITISTIRTSHPTNKKDTGDAYTSTRTILLLIKILTFQLFFE